MAFVVMFVYQALFIACQCGPWQCRGDAMPFQEKRIANHEDPRKTLHSKFQKNKNNRHGVTAYPESHPKYIPSK